MKLIEISHLGRGTSTSPTITFTLSGNIRINPPAVEKIFPDAFDDSLDNKCYLKFFQDEEKLFVQMNRNPDNGVYVRFDGGKGDRRNASNIVASAKAVIIHFAKLFDWPLSDDKRRVIRYEVGKEVEKGVFELI